MKGRWALAWLVSLAFLATAASGIADNTNSTPPGTLNYVEGQVSVQGQAQTQKSVGSTCLEPNQDITTGAGHAEMLLTPGVYLRLGNNSDVKMISPGLANTQVELMKGSAMMEVDQIFKQNDISVLVNGDRARVEKNGVYDFTANPGSVKVLDGKAVAYEDDQQVTVKKGHEALLAEAQPPSVQKFDENQVKNSDLYRWSDLRGEYATNSNVQEAQALAAYGGWWGPGWYWDPFWMDFAWMPGWGFGWGPFGFPFFSPWAVGYAPFYGFGVGGRFYRAAPVAMSPADPRAVQSAPRLAHPVTRGAPEFRALPHAMAMNRGGMRGMPMDRMGGFEGGRMDGGFGGFHGGMVGPRR